MRGARSWFRERYLSLDPRWMGVFRILLGTLLVVDLLRRWLDIRAFYTNDGVLPNHYALYRPMGPYIFSIYDAFSTFGQANIAFALTLIVYLLFALGYRTKLFHILSAICVTSLNARNVFLQNGGAVLVDIITIWTLFLPLGGRLSVDSVLRSLRTHPEHTAAELEDRSYRKDTRFVSLAALALILQWSSVYFLNAVQKTGRGWRDGTAIYWFWQQDRIATWLSVWARNHVPISVVHVMTYGTLMVEGTLGIILLIPFWQKWTRRIALLLALMLHGGIALTARLGSFSYVMVIFFVLLLGDADWALVGRWFGRPSRARQVIYDADCGICLQTCRILARFDPFHRLRFVANSDAARIPDSVDPALLDHTVVALDPAGRVFTEERAVYEILRALPFGIVGAFWLRVPGLSLLAKRQYRRVADNRMTVSEWFGLGACGVPRTEDAEPSKSGDEHEREAETESKARQEFASTLRFFREMLVVVLALVVGSELCTGNRFIRQLVTVREPTWMSAVVGYACIFQGWSLFAPEPPYEDGHLVVDGRTVDGRKLDPLTGKPPDFDPYTKTGWGLSQLWCDYENQIRNINNSGARQFLRDYLLHLHVYDGRPRDALVAFDVWWVQDRSPPPGHKRGQPLPPVELLSYGRVLDSGATPWLHTTRR